MIQSAQERPAGNGPARVNSASSTTITQLKSAMGADEGRSHQSRAEAGARPHRWKNHGFQGFTLLGSKPNGRGTRTSFAVYTKN